MGRGAKRARIRRRPTRPRRDSHGGRSYECLSRACIARRHCAVDLNTHKPPTRQKTRGADASFKGLRVHSTRTHKGQEIGALRYRGLGLTKPTPPEIAAKAPRGALGMARAPIGAPLHLDSHSCLRAQENLPFLRAPGAVMCDVEKRQRPTRYAGHAQGPA